MLSFKSSNNPTLLFKCYLYRMKEYEFIVANGYETYIDFLLNNIKVTSNQTQMKFNMEYVNDIDRLGVSQALRNINLLATQDSLTGGKDIFESLREVNYCNTGMISMKQDLKWYEA